MVNARRMCGEAYRRLGTAADAFDPAIDGAGIASSAPAAAASAAAASAALRLEKERVAFEEEGGVVGATAAAFATSAMTPSIGVPANLRGKGSRLPPLGDATFGKRMEEAADLLERVQRQLEHSAERTKGPGIVGARGRGKGDDLAPPR